MATTITREDLPEYDEAQDVSYDDAPQADYDEAAQPEYNDHLRDPDAEDSGSQEWYARKQK